MRTQKMRPLVGVSAVALAWLGVAGWRHAQEAVVGGGVFDTRVATQTTTGSGRSTAPAAAQSTAHGLTDRPEEEKAVRAVGETFTSAYNAGDAKAVAGLFAEDAELVDENGERIKGRPTIQAFFEAMFRERKGAKIEISLESLAFLGPEVAKEEGRTRVKPAEKEASDAVRALYGHLRQAGRKVALFQRARG